MAKFKVNKTKDYTIMSNYHLKEKNMSLKAKGLLSVMLSLPDNWDYSIAGLVAISLENETSIKSALSELKKLGYLEVIKLMPNESETGRIDYIYNIYEKPKQEGKKQEVENLPLEILEVENQGQLNTNNKYNNINIINTKKQNIDYINNNNKKERKKTSYDEILNSMVEDDDVKNTICDYIKMRKLIKKPMTDRALTMLINKLYKLSNNKQIQIKILEQSILKNWTDIYPYKEENNYAGYQGNAKTDLSKYDR